MRNKQHKQSRTKKFAEIEHISILGLVSEVGSLGLWVYAEAFWSAACALPEPMVPYEPTRYYLTCHSIELALKAYLSLQGITMIALAGGPYGHNLIAILDLAISKELKTMVALTDEHLVEIRKASTYYAGKVFEYPAIGEAMLCFPSLPNLVILSTVAKVLISTLETPCKMA